MTGPPDTHIIAVVRRENGVDHHADYITMSDLLLASENSWIRMWCEVMGQETQEPYAWFVGRHLYMMQPNGDRIYIGVWGDNNALPEPTEPTVTP